MVGKKSESSNSQYTLIKGALLDISPYVHAGLEIEEVEDIIAQVLIQDKKGYAKPVSGLLAYHIQTNYQSDTEVIKLMDKIVQELDAEMAKINYEDVIKKIN